VKGTQICRLDSGEVVRYVPKSGKTFSPNDIKTVYEHLDRLGQGAPHAKAAQGEERNQGGGRRRDRGGRKDAQVDNMSSQFEKVKGTEIRQIDGEVFRYVRESGRTFAPNDLKTVYDHLDKLRRDAGGGGKGKGKKGGAAMMALPGPSSSPKGGGKGKGNKSSMLALPAPSKVKKQHLKQERNTDRTELRKGRFANKVAKKKQQEERQGQGRKDRPGKEFTPEQLEARRQKKAGRHAARVEKDGRKVLDDVWHTGEIVQRFNAHALAKPLDTFAIPLEVRNKLEVANQRRREQHGNARRRRKKSDDDGNDDELIYLACADIDEEGLTGKAFRPPAKVQFKLYTDDKGFVGGCEIKSA